MTAVTTIASGRGPYTQTHTILGASGTAVSGGADTNENTLATIVVPAGAMGTNGILRVTSHWSVTSSGNNKICRIRYSGASGSIIANFTSTTQTILRIEGFVFNTSDTVQTTSGFTWASAGNSAVASTTPGVDTTAATSVVLTGAKASAGETLTLVNYIVELIRTT